ncbi:hypothetical protein BHE74_00025994 [Ensete ventricosum]|nr:hypothetical protein BHE74_00025994 [Ensete ventricosum]
MHLPWCKVSTGHQLKLVPRVSCARKKSMATALVVLAVSHVCLVQWKQVLGRREMEAPTTTTTTTGDGGLSALLSTEFLVSPSGNKVRLIAHPVNPKDIEGKTIGLYFAANWYQKCVSFTPLLVSVYHKLMEQELPFEIVFVSSDENQSSFEQFYSSMPWPAVPFSDLNSKRSLSHKFQIEGIPALIILEPGGGLIQTEGVEILCRYGLQAFPFTSERIAELEAEEKRKYASQTLEKVLAVSGKDHIIKHNDQVRALHLRFELQALIRLALIAIEVAGNFFKFGGKNSRPVLLSPMVPSMSEIHIKADIHIQSPPGKKRRV